MREIVEMSADLSASNFGGLRKRSSFSIVTIYTITIYGFELTIDDRYLLLVPWFCSTYYLGANASEALERYVDCLWVASKAKSKGIVH
jgi:hypothetical protein